MDTRFNLAMGLADKALAKAREQAVADHPATALQFLAEAKHQIEMAQIEAIREMTK